LRDKVIEFATGTSLAECGATADQPSRQRQSGKPINRGYCDFGEKDAVAQCGRTACIDIG
jgi:hypothetical protein